MHWVDATILTDDGEVPVRTLPVGELIAAALASDEDARWGYTGFLHLRGDRETFDAARSLCADPDPIRRTLGVDILGQVGALTLHADGTTTAVPVEERPFRVPAATLLLGRIHTEQDDDVLRALVSALGHLADPRAIDPVGRLRHHPHVMVRWSVTVALTPFAATDDAALAYVVELTGDPSRRVRDWSCFGLYQTHRDTPEIRQALLARATDTDPVTRAEALRALAHLGDARAVEPLLAALADTDADDETGEVAALLDEAREALGR